MAIKAIHGRIASKHILHYRHPALTGTARRRRRHSPRSLLVLSAVRIHSASSDCNFRHGRCLLLPAQQWSFRNRSAEKRQSSNSFSSLVLCHGQQLGHSQCNYLPHAGIRSADGRQHGPYMQLHQAAMCDLCGCNMKLTLILGRLSFPRKHLCEVGRRMQLCQTQRSRQARRANGRGSCRILGSHLRRCEYISGTHLSASARVFSVVSCSSFSLLATKR